MEYLVFASTIAVFSALLFIHPFKEWRKSIREHKSLALILVICFIIPHLGGGQSAEAAVSSLPTGIRLVRFIFVIVLLFMTANRLLKMPACLRMAGTAAKVMFGFTLFALFSSSWSVDMVMTGWKSIEILTISLACISLAGEIRNRDDIEHLINILSAIIMFYVLGIALGVVLAPELAFVHSDQAIYQKTATVVRGVNPQLNPNTVTQFGALMFVISFIHLIRRDHDKHAKGIWITLALGCIVMLLGHSRTSVFAGILAIASVLFFGRYRVFAIFLLFVGGIGAILSLDIFTSYILRGQSADAFAGMTGRVHFWASTLDFVQESLWIGHGFYAGQRVGIGVSSMDSTYLEVLVGLGIIGLTIFITPIIITAYNMFRMLPKSNDPKHATTLWLLLLGLFIILIVRSLTGPSFAVMHPNLPMYIILLISVHALRKYKYQDSSNGTPKNQSEETSDSTVNDKRTISKKSPKILHKK